MTNDLFGMQQYDHGCDVWLLPNPFIIYYAEAAIKKQSRKHSENVNLH